MQKYDKTSPESIKKFAEKLIWKNLLHISPPFALKENKWNKWNLWQLIEEFYFGKKLDNKSAPDFSEAWLELKVTPVKKIKNWEIRSKERLVLNIINYLNIVDENWETSSFIQKNSLILLMFYLYEKWKISTEYIIKFVELFKLDEYKDDYEIIKNDWITIQEKIKNWKAHELSEWDTVYLWACTKWSTALKSLRDQPYSKIKAKQRAFSFKQGYMNYIIKRIEWVDTWYEKLFKARTKTSSINTIKNVDGNKKIENWVFDFNTSLKKIFENYIWKSAFEIWNAFWIDYKKQKNYYAMLSNRIMWVSDSNKIEEFTKANIKLKTIRVNPNWNIKENISFPTFKFKELITQNWEESDLYNMLESQKFFFIIFKITTKTNVEFERMSDYEKNKHLILDKVILWNTPYQDIETKAKLTWTETIKIIKEGVKIEQRWNKTFNNLPSSWKTSMIHVRPHAQNKNDTDILPDGRELTKQCFWFNRKYIKKELWI